MKAYKLTDSMSMTKNNTLWGENITHEATGDDTQDLCSDGWIHFYQHPLIAVLMNPHHADFANPILWEGEAHEPFKHESLKSGCRSFTTIRQIPLPIISTVQRIAFGILCSLEGYKEPKYVQWANNWLSGNDRSRYTADAAAAAAAADAAAAAAAAAAYAADAYAAAAAADAAAYAADAADAAAYAADAADAARSNSSINFVALAEKALTYK